jgi:predicted nucleotide-binding protein
VTKYNGPTVLHATEGCRVSIRDGVLAMAKITTKASRPTSPPSKRPYLKQSDVPSASLDEALRVPQALLDHYAGKPTAPLQVAKALNMDPKGSQVRVLSGAAMAFGLIDGGAQASAISLTDLARRILRPKEENEDLAAKREAVLKPRVFGDFLRQYDGNAFPRQDIALNVIEEMGVPREKTEEVLERIDASARFVGFIEEIKGKNYVTLQGAAGSTATPETNSETEGQATTEDEKVPPDVERTTVPPPVVQPKGAALKAAIADDQRRRRVFITHGKSRDLVDPIKKLLEYGELEPVVSVEKQTVSKPVPEKVMDDMRGCGAAIIHVDVERTIVDKDGNDQVVLNPNVLIEIGAAMAFYGRRFILLVQDSVKLPSNLQGLYEVRYSGQTLDAHATIKLLEAIKDIKNYALPTQSEIES